MVIRRDVLKTVRIGYQALFASSFLIPSMQYARLFHSGAGNGLATARNAFSESVRKKVQWALTATFLPAILITFYDISNIGSFF